MEFPALLLVVAVAIAALWYVLRLPSDRKLIQDITEDILGGLGGGPGGEISFDKLLAAVWDDFQCDGTRDLDYASVRQIFHEHLYVNTESGRFVYRVDPDGVTFHRFYVTGDDYTPPNDEEFPPPPLVTEGELFGELQ